MVDLRHHISFGICYIFWEKEHNVVSLDRDAWVAFPRSLAACLSACQPLTPAVYFALSGNSSYGLGFPHMKGRYCTCRSKVDWALNVLHLWQSSVRVWLYLFKHSLHFQKVKNMIPTPKKNSEVDKIVEPLSIRASCLGFPVIACSAEVV